jgi:hypothetical protein
VIDLKLRRRLRRWIATIRETLLEKISGSPSQRYEGALAPPTEHQLEIIKRDLNQCERMLLDPDIEHDPVLEIWRKKGERAGVFWYDFEPKPMCFHCKKAVANGFSGRCLECTLKHQAACEHKNWDTGLDSCLDCGGGSTRK